MFMNLLAAIEADINQASIALQQMQSPKEAPGTELIRIVQLQSKKEQLINLAMQYVKLQNQYREVCGANSIY